MPKKLEEEDDISEGPTDEMDSDDEDSEEKKKETDDWNTDY